MRRSCTLAKRHDVICGLGPDGSQLRAVLRDRGGHSAAGAPSIGDTDGVRWRGRFFLDRGLMLYDGPAGATTPHAHHAFQILVAAAAPARIASRDGSASTTAAIIPPDQPHAFAEPSPRVVLLYVAPESRAGRDLATLVARDARLDRWIEAATPLADLPVATIEDAGEARELAGRVLERLAGASVAARPWPPAIQRLVALLPNRLDDELRLPALAAELGLSESRLSHLITEHLGIPFRPYVLWLRLLRAGAELAAGRSITECAHAAGFADGPHLSRMFRRMFGITPSDVAAHATWHVSARP